jgi:hypothetical protein
MFTSIYFCTLCKTHYLKGSPAEGMRAAKLLQPFSWKQKHREGHYILHERQGTIIIFQPPYIVQKRAQCTPPERREQTEAICALAARRRPEKGHEIYT